MYINYIFKINFIFTYMCVYVYICSCSITRVSDGKQSPPTKPSSQMVLRKSFFSCWFLRLFSHSNNVLMLSFLSFRLRYLWIPNIKQSHMSHSWQLICTYSSSLSCGGSEVLSEVCCWHGHTYSKDPNASDPWERSTPSLMVYVLILIVCSENVHHSFLSTLHPTYL